METCCTLRVVKCLRFKGLPSFPVSTCFRFYILGLCMLTFISGSTLWACLLQCLCNTVVCPAADLSSWPNGSEASSPQACAPHHGYMLLKLQISCDDAGFGCTTTLRLDQLQSHLKAREHNSTVPTVRRDVGKWLPLGRKCTLHCNCWVHWLWIFHVILFSLPLQLDCNFCLSQFCILYF